MKCPKCQQNFSSKSDDVSFIEIYENKSCYVIKKTMENYFCNSCFSTFKTKGEDEYFYLKEEEK